MTKRKNHFADFKARVAVEAIREELTLSELAKNYGVHATQISTWKRATLDNMSSAFSQRRPFFGWLNGTLSPSHTSQTTPDTPIGVCRVACIAAGTQHNITNQMSQIIS